MAAARGAGEGQAALDLLPLVEAAPAAVADEARAVALLAARPVRCPFPRKPHLFKSRLRHVAAGRRAGPPCGAGVKRL